MRSVLTRHVVNRVGRRRLLWISGGAHVVMTVVLALVGGSLRRSSGRGIVALELAGSAERGEEILAGWGPVGRAAARRSLLLDFPYMLTYGAFMIAVTDWAADGLRDRGLPKLAAAGSMVGCAQILAVASDAVEGVALLTFLRNPLADGCARLARHAALTKFGCLSVGLSYLAVGVTAPQVIRT